MRPDLKNWKEIKFNEKEARLMEAYVEVAYKEGVENVTLQKVADHAKTAYATVHYYFGQSDLSMIEKALIYVGGASEKYIEQQMNSFLMKGDTNSVRAYLDAKFDWNEKYPKYASIWCYFTYQSSRDKEYRELNAAFFDSNKQRMKTLLLLESGKGTYPQLKNVDVLADRIYQVILGAMFLSMSAVISLKEMGRRKQTTLEMIEMLIALSVR